MQLNRKLKRLVNIISSLFLSFLFCSPLSDESHSACHGWLIEAANRHHQTLPPPLTPPLPDVNNLLAGSRWGVTPAPLVYFIIEESLDLERGMLGKCGGVVATAHGREGGVGLPPSLTETVAAGMEMGERD